MRKVATFPLSTSNDVKFANRTTFFMKENKHYTHASFWLPVVYVFTLGLFFSEESRSTRVLHRDQTDEWKGEWRIKRYAPLCKSTKFTICLLFRLDAARYFDIPHHRGESSAAALYANENPRIQLPISHRLRAFVLLLERRQC